MEAPIPGNERRVRERLYIEAGKQVVHHRVADQHDLPQFGAARARHLGSHPTDCVSYERRQSRIGQGIEDTAHHVGAMRGLRIQARAQTEDFT